jgi:hypothetical protein
VRLDDTVLLVTARKIRHRLGTPSSTTVKLAWSKSRNRGAGPVAHGHAHLHSVGFRPKTGCWPPVFALRASARPRPTRSAIPRIHAPPDGRHRGARMRGSYIAAAGAYNRRVFPMRRVSYEAPAR